MQLKTLGNKEFEPGKCFSITLGNGALTAVSLAYALANFDVEKILVYGKESKEEFIKTFKKVYLNFTDLSNYTPPI